MDDVLINLGFDINHSKFDCRFCATFGVSYYLANIFALKIAGTTVIPVYLLLALHFLKNYNTENVMSVFFNLDEKTIRKWVRIYVQYICEINTINFSDRYINVPAGKKILVSVDGVDCPYKENSRPVDPGYCSHKLKRSALRYEVGVALYSSRICSGRLISDGKFRIEKRMVVILLNLCLYFSHTFSFENKLASNLFF